MKCPNCQIRDMALEDRVRVLQSVPDGSERLWCPNCGHVVERPVGKVVVEPASKTVAPVQVKQAVDVPRGTSRRQKAVKRLKGGR